MKEDESISLASSNLDQYDCFVEVDARMTVIPSSMEALYAWSFRGTNDSFCYGFFLGCTIPGRLRHDRRKEGIDYHRAKHCLEPRQTDGPRQCD